MMKYVLTIAGSDSIGGAGIQADIRTIAGLGSHPLTVITAVTAQNSFGIAAIHRIPTDFISLQLKSIVEDIHPDAAKIGVVYSAETIRELAGFIRRKEISPLVLDPVLRATTGKSLLETDALIPFTRDLLPQADVVTPNLDEAELIIGSRVRNLKQMEEAAKRIKEMGPHVVIKGGHLEGECIDLFYDGKHMEYFRGARIDTPHTHGTGCVFSSAMATFLALGHSARDAASSAHDFTRLGIERGYACGRGAGAVDPPRDFL